MSATSIAVAMSLEVNWVRVYDNHMGFYMHVSDQPEHASLMIKYTQLSKSFEHISKLC